MLGGSHSAFGAPHWTAQARIREAITRSRPGKLTALLHHIDVAVLRASFFGLKKSAAPGVDEMTWAKYAETLEADLTGDTRGQKAHVAMRLKARRAVRPDIRVCHRHREHLAVQHLPQHAVP